MTRGSYRGCEVVVEPSAWVRLGVSSKRVPTSECCDARAWSPARGDERFVLLACVMVILTTRFFLRKVAGRRPAWVQRGPRNRTGRSEAGGYGRVVEREAPIVSVRSKREPTVKSSAQCLCEARLEASPGTDALWRC